MSFYSVTLPIKVGLVGTGYAAKLRAESFTADDRSTLVAVAGHNPAKVIEFAATYGAKAIASWEELVQQPELDLLVVANINRDHAAVVRAALEANKHVVVEYPLALDVAEAEALIALAASKHLLLHVEHIELLSGIHTAIAEALPEIGTPFYVRYSNLNPQRPAPQKWTYQSQQFGFPLMGALSRLHRLTNLFGSVGSVTCQTRFWGDSGLGTYTSCLCTAQLRFTSGLVAEVIYGKGEAFWQAERTFMVQGDRGCIAIEGEEGQLIRDNGAIALEMGSRRGLFAKDTALVLNHLEKGEPLYVEPESSLYAMRVAAAARKSAETGQTIDL